MLFGYRITISLGREPLLLAQCFSPAPKLFLSNRSQVSIIMVYKVINHVGCWQNMRRIHKSLTCSSWFTNSLSVLPTSQVVASKPTRNLWSLNNLEDALFFHESTSTRNHSWLTTKYEGWCKYFSPNKLVNLLNWCRRATWFVPEPLQSKWRGFCHWNIFL